MINAIMLLEGEVTGMAGALANLQTVITQVMGIVEDNATLFACFVVPLLGAGIGLVKRLV